MSEKISDTIRLIIPCYWANDGLVDLTRNCLESLRGFLGRITIVDDGSPIKWDYGKQFDVSSVVLENNVGYAGAVNAGLKEAKEDFIIVANNDTEFIDPYWLHHLITPLKNGYDISSIRTTDADGWETRDWLEENAKFGSLWAMKRKVYDSLGGLNEEYGKGYFEDLDYHRRAEVAGFKVVKNHAGLVEHKGKATFKVVDPEDTSFLEAREKFIKTWGVDKL